MGKQREYILMAGTAGAAGALFLLRQNYEAMSERYSQGFMREAEIKLCEASGLAPRFGRLAGELTGGCGGTLKAGCSCAEVLAGEGLFRALFRLGKELHSGLTVELERIPVLQAAIEICEFADVSPYEIDSGGVFFAVTEDICGCREWFEGRGISLECIGRLTSGNDRTVKNGGERRFLTP